MATTILETCRAPTLLGATADLSALPPIAGDLIFPLNSEKKPKILYMAEDSIVSLTIVESGSDFDHLIGNHAQDVDQFYEFVSEIDLVANEPEYQRVPVMPLKVTLFPGRDRSVIKDPLGIDTIFWKADIKKLKDLALVKKSGLLQVSSFVVTASYVWTCFVKSEEQVDDDDVLEFFIFKADIRARIDPPVPANYFGNCLGHGVAKLEHKQLVGEEGFVIAVEAIADQIKNRVNNKEQVLKGAENWLSDIKKMFGIRAFGVSGSRNLTCPVRILDGEGQESWKWCPLIERSIPCLCASQGILREDWRLVCLCLSQEWKLSQLSLKTI
ncbi:UNVERIFIED_CONTAM: Malonyl-coenzyme:anthocyanin 5-O-glucoside-6'''-O-malonyltransferase [Sesamum latifolium]|uniref:Malonyl-coenzyme:anthocyanin 5-O-glucoside-6'''-O-malonyltransferase n=1 Tax=Sesamum latifolium TaxID=2727402 RepID=A0AAW2U2A2_9LAMI